MWAQAQLDAEDRGRLGHEKSFVCGLFRGAGSQKLRLLVWGVPDKLVLKMGTNSKMTPCGFVSKYRDWGPDFLGFPLNQPQDYL